LSKLHPNPANGEPHEFSAWSLATIDAPTKACNALSDPGE
jgi:hypothetical protein